MQKPLPGIEFEFDKYSNSYIPKMNIQGNIITNKHPLGYQSLKSMIPLQIKGQCFAVRVINNKDLHINFLQQANNNVFTCQFNFPYLQYNWMIDRKCTPFKTDKAKIPKIQNGDVLKFSRASIQTISLCIVRNNQDFQHLNFPIITSNNKLYPQIVMQYQTKIQVKLKKDVQNNQNNQNKNVKIQQKNNESSAVNKQKPFYDEFNFSENALIILKKQCIDSIELLMALTQQDMKEIGLPRGDIIKLRNRKN